MDKGISYHTIKGILIKHLCGQISKELVLNLQSDINNLLLDVCRSLNEELQTENQCRERFGLPPKRRIDTTLYIKCKPENINPKNDLIPSGEKGKSKNTFLSNAEMEVA